MIKAVIFDMDGTLVDSEPISSKSLEILLKRYGITPFYNENGLIHTVGVAGDTYESLREKYGIKDDPKVIRKKRRRIYTTLLKKDLTLKKGFLPLATSLRKQSIRIGLASNSHKKAIRLITQILSLNEFFDVTVGPSATIRHKPEPDIYLKVAKKLRVCPNECVVLEDSETGVCAGKSAGMKVIAVPNEYTASHDFSKADLIVNSLKDIKWSTIKNI